MVLEILKYLGIVVGVVSFGLVVFAGYIVYFLSHPDNYR